MKKLSMLLFVFFITYSGLMFSQKNELKYKNDIYIYNAENRHIYNKENRVKIQKTCEFSVKSDLSFPCILKKIFPEKHLQTLIAKKAILAIIFYCNERGEILEMEFILAKVSLEDITLPIISNLEKTLRGKQFKLRNTCPDVKYYMLVKVIRFDDL